MGYPGLTFDGDPAPRTGQVSLVIAAFSSGRLLVTRKAGKGSGNPFYSYPPSPTGVLNLRIYRSPLYQEPTWKSLRQRGSAGSLRHYRRRAKSKDLASFKTRIFSLFSFDTRSRVPQVGLKLTL